MQSPRRVSCLFPRDALCTVRGARCTGCHASRAILRGRLLFIIKWKWPLLRPGRVVVWLHGQSEARTLLHARWKNYPAGLQRRSASRQGHGTALTGDKLRRASGNLLTRGKRGSAAKVDCPGTVCCMRASAAKLIFTTILGAIAAEGSSPGDDVWRANAHTCCAKHADCKSPSQSF